MAYLTYAEPGDYGGGLALARARLNMTATAANLRDVGDRQRMTPAQDPDQPVGKILHLTLDGKPAPDNPYTFKGPNLTPAETWTIGHRTPYGLAFSPTGELWEIEHAKLAERWSIGKRVRDVAEAPDGSPWRLEDASAGALIRLTPK